MSFEKERRLIKVNGIVQGVGFRPFVYRLAQRAGLSGYVRNDAAGVTIEVEGEPALLEHFTLALEDQAPPLAVIEGINVERLPVYGSRKRAKSFVITSSEAAEGRDTFISPDVATCEDCLRELFDPGDRRYLYPFINCTHCGPRFTIIRDLPYDRPYTTMAAFVMCADCRREYHDPDDRRFHAQPVACPLCGPRVSLEIQSDKQGMVAGTDAILEAQRLLLAGKIIAVKGLGGYHLACDARNPEVVRRLRQGKRRQEKPFALMGADVRAIEAVCELGAAERALILDRRRPIVLLRAKEEAAVAPQVAPGQNRLGIMLPYTPLHYLLFHSFNPADFQPVDLLVMTSGNLSDEPILYRDEDAFERLAPIADAFLGHDREIEVRCDDSVFQVIGDQSPGAASGLTEGSDGLVAGRHSAITVAMRRSRGYAPQPLPLGFEFERPVLAVGGHLKNTFCLGKGRYAFVSHHIGDLDSIETLASFQEGVEHFKRIFEVKPEIIARDLHPDYLSSKWAQEQRGSSASLIPVQHHHAHIASVLAEHKMEGPVIGVAFDGTGYGTDGKVWGGEFLIADLQGFERHAHLAYIPLPGGERAIRQPWRVAAAYMDKFYGDGWLDQDLDFARRIDLKQWQVIRQIIAREINSPLTSSVGRLFDAVATLVGFRGEVNFEGQAAMALEALADDAVQDAYKFTFGQAERDAILPYAISPREVFDELLADLQTEVPVAVMAAKFHNGLAGMIVEVCGQLRQDLEINQVALSGGVFQNALLLSRTMELLARQGFEAFTNNQVPPNDGGLSLGQAAVAAHTNQREDDLEDHNREYVAGTI